MYTYAETFLYMYLYSYLFFLIHFLLEYVTFYDHVYIYIFTYKANIYIYTYKAYIYIYMYIYDHTHTIKEKYDAYCCVLFFKFCIKRMLFVILHISYYQMAILIICYSILLFFF